ncbi:sensor histidine kinase (plasmid) [Clostridium taeniosporum]|uniref:histidine kinase n=1 Tax=Clostridium taeniosporum TaxID=394958 RepID=A0A1D7XP99_9CLOT|nr:sensor histidine kinase [Clostridium taeniosporum]
MQIKIRKKLSIWISLIVVCISIISIAINVIFVDKYYIYEKRKILNKVGEEIVGIPAKDIINNIDKIEEDSAVIIVYSDINGNLEYINEDIIRLFEKKKIKLNKFWITKDTLNKLESSSVNKIYDQGLTKYKVLTKFIKIDDYLFVIGMPLVNMDETIGIINKFNMFLMVISIILILFLIYIISKKIVRPIENLKELSRDIAVLNFRKEDIKTNDEIEELAESINEMSEKIEKAHNEINTQNKRLKGLISDISHELKTPLALVKVYSQGLEDGLDDGTYIETIQKEVDNMNFLIEKLLFWAKLENKKINKSKFDLGKKIIATTNKYKLIIKENKIDLSLNIDATKEYIVNGDEDGIEVVLNNLITNAIKYTYDKKIEISIFHENNKIKFTIANGINKYNIDEFENIWRPFYVLEKSRSKELSGTGLGLPIVKSILDNHSFDCGFNIENDKIEFFVTFT